MNRKLANEELGRPSVEEFKRSSKNPIVVVLDNVRSFNNVGSVFRTSDAFAIESIALCGITAQPPHREINKTALGATESVDWEYFSDTLDAIKVLKSKGYLVYAIEQAENSISLEQFKVNVGEKIAIIMGHEVNGVSQEAINMADGVIEIPQDGTKHSLNISVSAGVVLWDLIAKIKKA
ncbi:MAG: TrmH family RNA methyltransferase [Bacteroidetes bacterium]|nr:MAG: TrmH family RNA methyltransferase [Bacteroidota bacterium]MBL1143999.1 TrmH family RNA methyltransferase [Bacteroidota bacterium]MCB0803899.1 RNA methyltransferase [Flavobacteriales bacterium]NOG56800.1 RNA methyltransferase [Bacteroidota bacterium]